MEITSEEIRDKKFGSKIIGCNPKEVELFLETVADAFDGLNNEVRRLSDEVKRYADDLEMYKGREESIIKTIMASDKVCDDMKKNAEKESRIILSDAEMKAEKIIDDAHKKIVNLRDEITELRRQKIQFEESLRSSLTTHLKLLDISAEKDEETKG